MARDQDATVAYVPSQCPWDTDRWIDRSLEGYRKKKKKQTRMGREEEG